MTFTEWDSCLKYTIILTNPLPSPPRTTLIYRNYMTNYSPTHRKVNPQLTPNTNRDNGIQIDKIQFIRNLKGGEEKKAIYWEKISNPFEQKKGGENNPSKGKRQILNIVSYINITIFRLFS